MMTIGKYLVETIVSNRYVIDIPIDATNGDVVKAMFPNAKIEHKGSGLLRLIVDGWSFEIAEDWWNASYKVESEE